MVGLWIALIIVIIFAIIILLYMIGARQISHRLKSNLEEIRNTKTTSVDTKTEPQN